MRRADKPLALLPFAVKTKIGDTMRGHEHSKVAKRKMSVSQKAAWRRRREKKQTPLL